MPYDRIIVIPDIHGLVFWKSAVSALPNALLIFLGDYLDPYDDEDITPDKAYYNLIEIVDLKKQFPDNVILLWGNHDLHYMYRNLMGSRYDHDNSERFFQFFWQNQDLFQIAYDTVIGNTTYLFSHAGVGRKWAEHLNPKFSTTPPTAAALNALFHTRSFIEALNARSDARGGWSDYGSMIWADYSEQTKEENQYKDIVQIFGHTHQQQPLIIDNRIYCLDCGSSFSINVKNSMVGGGDKELDIFINMLSS